jgi:hypothetical protein
LRFKGLENQFFIRFMQLRRPATLLPIAACSAWVLVNHAGSLGSGGETFSSGAILALPSFRASFVLRDRRHSKGKACLFSACQKLKRRNAAEVIE